MMNVFIIIRMFAGIVCIQCFVSILIVKLCSNWKKILDCSKIIVFCNIFFPAK